MRTQSVRFTDHTFTQRTYNSCLRIHLKPTLQFSKFASIDSKYRIFSIKRRAPNKRRTQINAGSTGQSLK